MTARQKLPRIPKLTKATIQKIADEMPAHMARIEAEENDRRCMRGKYAPPTGTCRVCGGIIVAQIRFPHTGRLGGPPTNAYVSHYHCEGCGLMYQEIKEKSGA